MRSKALVETHLLSHIPKSLDVLGPNHEITGNTRSEWKYTNVGRFWDNAQTGGDVRKMNVVHYPSPTYCASLYQGVM